MFRSNQYCSRYEETPIQLDNTLTIPGNNGMQKRMDIDLQLMIEVHILIGLMDTLKLNLLLIN